MFQHCWEVFSLQQSCERRRMALLLFLQKDWQKHLQYSNFSESLFCEQKIAAKYHPIYKLSFITISSDRPTYLNKSYSITILVFKVSFPKMFPNLESAVKCLSQEHNRMAQVGFEPRPC